MENESISKQSMEKLQSMSRNDKIRLFNRLRIIELNKIISAILANTVGESNIRKTKAKIIHQLYDQNIKSCDEYKELQEILDNGQNFYDQLDHYTTAAYANYYALFAKYADGVRNSDGLNFAMAKAYNEARACVRTNELKIHCDNSKNPISTTLLQAKYRRDIISYLEYELKTTFNLRETIVFKEQKSAFKEEESNEEELTDDRKTRSRNARSLEEYTSSTGETYYLDADGEYFRPDEVGI